MDSHLSLLEFCSRVRSLIDEQAMESWVCAEIAQVQVSRGHYYIELVQKSETSDQPVAKLRCTLWAGAATRVLGEFEEATGSRLESGMKVLMRIVVTFHEVFGLSGNVRDIDPSYTLGDLEARRQVILEQLRQDGVIDMNKQLELPRVIKRVAVISAATAAGYGDFCNQIRNNGYGIGISLTLFPATVQGAGAERSIVMALDRVAEQMEEFDVVVVIRGGGSKMDLACFDSYEIAMNIAQFPLPVLTGIGHERDRSIADIVANTSLKTPTAVAEFLVQHDMDVLADLDILMHRLTLVSRSKIQGAMAKTDILLQSVFAVAQRCLDRQSMKVERLEMRALNAIGGAVSAASAGLDNLEARLLMASASRVRQEAMRRDSLETRLHALDPRQVLARGFSVLTSADGRQLTSVAQVADGDVVCVYVADGVVKAKVIS